MIKKLLFLYLLFITTSIFSQYTQIPDINFENALSAYDDISNDGQIPTVNINTITLLDVSNQNITNLNGIEDFTLLENLHCNNNQLLFLDLYSNFELKYLDCSNNLLNIFSLIPNQQLEWFNCSNNNELVAIDLQNGNNTNINEASFFANSCPNLQCIIVDDVDWSETNWTNIEPTSIFTSDETECTVVNVNDNIFKENLSIYPNPATNYLKINNNSNVKISTISITNLLGKNIKQCQISENIEISNLENGMYFVKIVTEFNSTLYYKFIKE